MKASLEQLDNGLNQSLGFRHFSLPYFDAPYHFHPEYELTLIVRVKAKDISVIMWQILVLEIWF
jgi:hypothetical protein